MLYQNDAAQSADPLPRWDSIGVIPPDRAGDPYIRVLAADTQHPVAVGQCAVLGVLTSPDGIRWRPLSPATAPGLFPSYEVPECVEISGRHYVLFSTNTTAGARFVPGDPLAQGGTYYVVADALLGPYIRPPVHPLLHGHRIAGREFTTYVGRPFTTSQGELLFYHHWAADPPDGWWGPPKRLVERRPHVLGLDYWPGCEALKVATSETGLTADAMRPLPSAGELPVVTWTVNDGNLTSGNAGGAHGAQWFEDARESGDVPESSGRIVETGLQIQQGRGLGLWVGYRGSASMFVVSLNAESQQLEFGTMTWLRDGSSLNLHIEELVDCPLTAGVTYRVRLLIRHAFAEIYVDDQLVRSFACREELQPSVLGFFSDLADGAFLNPRRWLMTM